MFHANLMRRKKVCLCFSSFQWKFHLSDTLGDDISHSKLRKKLQQQLNSVEMSLMHLSMGSARLTMSAINCDSSTTIFSDCYRVRAPTRSKSTTLKASQKKWKEREKWTSTDCEKARQCWYLSLQLSLFVFARRDFTTKCKNLQETPQNNNDLTWSCKPQNCRLAAAHTVMLDSELGTKIWNEIQIELKIQIII